MVLDEKHPGHGARFHGLAEADEVLVGEQADSS